MRSKQVLVFGDAKKYIIRKSRKGDVSFVKAVSEVLDRADRLAERGKTRRAVPLYSAVASLDAENRLITDAVDHARRFLENHGVSSDPSARTAYQIYLASLPPLDRHVMLARQVIRRLSSTPPGPVREQLIAEAINHFENALAYGPFSKRDQRILDGLRASRSP